MAAMTHLPILAGVDGSDASVAALRFAGTLADAVHAPLRAVIVWDHPDFGAACGSAAGAPDLEAQQLLFRAITQAFGDSPPSALRADVVRGLAAPTLIDESRHARMLVVGARGAGGCWRLLLGSVSEACARHARCPVLVLRDPTAEFPGLELHGVDQDLRPS